MRKLILIALIALSPMTFAKEFNADLLVGEWQCDMNDFSNKAFKASFSDKTIWYSNHTFENDGQTFITYNDFDGGVNIEYKVQGKWSIEDNVLTYITLDIPKYIASSDHPILQSRLDNKRLKNRTIGRITTLEIQSLSKDKLIMIPTLDMRKQLQGTSTQICSRIK